MKSFNSAVGWLMGIGLITAVQWVRVEADTRFIRLRNGTVETAEPVRTGARPQAAVAEPRVSGLFLLQFTGRIEQEWKEQLRTERVECLKYIPDDAFLVNIESNQLGRIRALPFVRWVGEYGPGFKLDPRLSRQVGTIPLMTPIEVKVLLSPSVPQAVLIGTARLFSPMVHTSGSRFGRVLRGWIRPERLQALTQSRAVMWIEPAPRMKLVDEISTKIVTGDDGKVGGLGVVHQMGFDGSGVTVAVADSGLDTGDADFIHPDIEGRVDGFFAYGGLPDASDEHSHGTHCAGIVAGNGATGEKDDDGNLWGLGVAPGAHLVGQRLFDREGGYFAPPSFEQLTRDAVRSGAYVGSNSWGDDTGGQYDISAAEFDALVRDADSLTPGEQQYILEFSAGNSGPGAQTIGSPAVAKNVIATGACENDRFGFGIYDSGAEVMADFSSRGPCEDGRIKPDVTAPGTWIASLKSQFAGEDNAWAPINPNYLFQGGTSQAGPHASGACAIIVQWYRTNHLGATPSPALVKAALINSALDMTTAIIPDDGGGFGGEEDPDGGGLVVGDTLPVPNNDEGWGRIDLENLIATERRYELVEQGEGLRTGQTYEQRVLVGRDDILKITLVYTDVPGLPAAIPALVNDLDLEVEGPDGQLYRGNAFSQGESIAGTPVGDRVNNVEAVHLSTPSAGEYRVRVRGVNVVQDVHGKLAGAPEQDFALVISGQLPKPGEGIVSWNRTSYRAGETARIRLVDGQIANQPTVPVTVMSGSQPAPATILLVRDTASVVAGSFTGAVFLAAGPGLPPPGGLLVSDADTIRVVYTDEDPAGNRVAEASIDSSAPMIVEVAAGGEFGRNVIRWTTSELATSTVVFGLSNSITTVTNLVGFREQHRVVLPELEAGLSYFYYVVSSDAAGNVSTNNNDGRYFRFVGAKAAAALLVYNPETIFSASGVLSDTPYPGREEWTESLNAIGLEYDIWDVGEKGVAPRAADLKPYRVVLWRPEELAGTTPGMLSSLASYVDGGGSLFISSYDLLSRLAQPSELAFRTNVLRVASFEEDGGATRIESVGGDPVGARTAMDLDYNQFPSGFVIDLLGIQWESGPDHLRLTTNGAPVFQQEDGRPVGVRYPRTGENSRGRMVFFSFALESLPRETEAPNNRATVLGNVLQFLVPGLRDSSSIAFDQQAYALPSSVVIEVTDSRKLGATNITVQLSVGTNVAVPELPLYATPTPGVFRGQFTLTTSNGSTNATTFRAAHGDTVQAIYVDAADREDLTESMVDTIKPVISEVADDPAYNEALIVWETDKPTDALVRFGESRGDDSFLSRSAYSSELATSHVVQVNGLLPDRNYYYQVVSRDAAGNITVDNNGGRLYVVRTLKPVTAPWLDSLESGRTGWAVYNDSASTGFIDEDDDGGLFNTSGWTYGVPENRHSITAHSGTNCWATNLKGDGVDFAISDLISPAISLVGGNQARLRFWHNYDFQNNGGTGDDDGFGDISIEAAQVAISTNNGATWSSIYAAQDETSLGWEEVEVDISKYSGAVVRFRFNYQMFSFNTTDRVGWLLDDVEVYLNAVAPTVIRITNNIAQARYVITGPTNLAGAGQYLSTNVPAGEYHIRWANVPYYVTPGSQTNLLGTNGPITFHGIYTFPDSNTNGLSDLWEEKFFGSAVPGYTGGEDRDADGVSDANEFLSGTDPTLASSVLRVAGPLVQANRTVKFEWPGSIGREYVLEVSNDLTRWQSTSEALRGIGGTLQTSLPALDVRLPYFFRVRVNP